MARILTVQRRPAWAPKDFTNAVECHCGNFTGTVAEHKVHATNHAQAAATRLGLNKGTRRLGRVS